MNKKKTKDKPSSIPSEPKISFKLGAHISERIDMHLRSLKFLEKKDIKKKEWFAAAIKEKLQKEKKQPVLAQIPQRKHILFPLNEKLYQELQDHISLIKRHCKYSSKELIIEAILEKLEREEHETKVKFAKLNS